MSFFCSFCKKSQDDVMTIIVSNSDICICDECILLCNKIIIELAQKRYRSNELNRKEIFNEFWAGA